MKKLFSACFAACLLLSALVASAGDSTGVKLVYSKQRMSDTEVLLSIKAIVAPGIKLYGLQKRDGDALYSTIEFDSAASKYLSGKLIETGKTLSENDPSINAVVSYYGDSVLWQQKIKAKRSDIFVLRGSVACFLKQGENYLPVEEKFKFSISPEAVQAVSVNADKNLTTDRSVLWIFLTAFGAGLLALLTPCVYSMIPITVSFFTKRSKTRPEGIRNALYYSGSIVIIFTLLGFLITLIFGPAVLNNLATNWIANLVFFALFLVFGVSFLGAFEIALPASWSTKANSKAGARNFLGIFFMALTLAVVSFSCTGPIIGNLLVLAAKGNYWGPLTGMFGFSLALALPFALFAFFPSRLNVLGKAGGWLNAVKVTLGFLELALALKFLSNADLARGWRILDREIFIAAWIVIFVLLGIYLLGKIKFRHDEELPKNDFGHRYLSMKRLFFAMAAFVFAVYMLPGLWGAPLKGISAFVPPMGTQDFTSSGHAGSNNSQYASSETNQGPQHPTKYYDQMKMYEPDVVTKYGLVTYFDYNEALEVARKLKKPLMLDFTGINCVNCRKMEGQVWSDPKVMQRLKEDFVIVSLYVDVHQIDIPEGEQYFSSAMNQKIETLGDKNTDMQVTKFGANTQPYYFFLDANEQRLAPEGYGYDPNVNKFLQLLDTVKDAYNKTNSSSIK